MLRHATVRELAYKVKERAGHDRRPRFAFLLGAGASVSSGIPTCDSMVRHFKKALNERRNLDEAQEPFEVWLSRQPWYTQDATEYSKLFEAYEPKAWGRQQHIERLVEGKQPSFGYFFLANLIRSGFIRTIVTTNFDDLVYAACTRWTEVRPVVYAYGIMASEIRFGAQRPRILKLHGDFLYSRLKNIASELADTDPNMARQVNQLFQEEGLVVVGYAGADASILQILERFPKDNDLYWCVLKGHQPSEKVCDILVEKGGFVVETAGFDQMLDTIQACVGFRLPEIEEEAHRRRTELVESLRASNSPNLSIYLGEVREALEAERADPAVARRERFRTAQAAAIRGIQALNLGRVQEAVKHSEEALAIARDIEAEGIQATTLGSLGIAYYFLGQTERALEYETEALAIDRDAGRRDAEGRRLSNLAVTYSALGQTQKGIAYNVQALAIARETGNKKAENVRLANMGIAHLILGDTLNAIEYSQQALAVAREIADRELEGRSLANLATILVSKADPAAQSLFREAALALREAARTSPRDPEIPYLLGIALLGEGAVEKGLVTLRKASRSSPYRGLIRDVLREHLAFMREVPGAAEATAFLEASLKAL